MPCIVVAAADGEGGSALSDAQDASSQRPFPASSPPTVMAAAQSSSVEPPGLLGGGQCQNFPTSLNVWLSPTTYQHIPCKYENSHARGDTGGLGLPFVDL